MSIFSIKAMTEADLAAVAEVEQVIYEFPWTERNFGDSLRAGYDAHCMWIDHQLAAYLVMMRVVDEYHLLNLSVRVDLQGHGYGRHLLQWGIGRAKGAGMDGMLLEVRPSNVAAKTLYETEGFKLIGVRKNYYPAREGREDALVLFKRFQDMGM
ncbi:MAG TPA: ribosomal protein S18-alanine N-acetyltransferase [Limnobacter sp.]|uniref:ribosomal protein S18-alanine N-acetyltransferase n=1 Tax=Limnobacter sp. TaxID=2003368 RepID=UPI002E3194D0|nr:ribosomal protein S18-alanine N-acetyltransferase [Limnobacter sp.]HEX5486418.1 ribosomal protein S18-alanine N-acetyltransferase [Limnobacter sp.]